MPQDPALARAAFWCRAAGRRLTLTSNQAYELVMNVAEGKLDSAGDIAAILATATEPRR